MADNEDSSKPPRRGPDWFLQNLVEICNADAAISFSITLSVGGILVSGHTIGGVEYFNGFADDLTEAGLRDEEANAFRALADIYVKQQEDESPDRALPEFIHLKNARFFHTSGSPIPANRGVFWRGRLEAVDSFILGVLAADT